MLFRATLLLCLALIACGCNHESDRASSSSLDSSMEQQQNDSRIPSSIAASPNSLNTGMTQKTIDSKANDKLIPITDAEQVVAVTTHDWGLMPTTSPEACSSGKNKLVVAVWADGTVVWSKNRTAGGAPYLTGKIEPASYSSLIQRMDRDGYFSSESLSQAKFGPDSQFTSMLIKNKNQKLEMQSWHELYERSGKIVCTSRGATALKGKRLASLSTDKIEYVHYRLAWAELRLMINQLLPANGESVDGDIQMKRGTMSWKPRSK